mmetsp:Transcript_1434/g.3972  ORF Transcript_1434/g.3972 Transcript_1434/m.3972 type:complete len:229 (+) Transcript_1434:885-1571(+)
MGRATPPARTADSNRCTPPSWPSSSGSVRSPRPSRASPPTQRRRTWGGSEGAATTTGRFASRRHTKIQPSNSGDHPGGSRVRAAISSSSTAVRARDSRGTKAVATATTAAPTRPWGLRARPDREARRHAVPGEEEEDRPPRAPPLLRTDKGRPAPSAGRRGATGRARAGLRPPAPRPGRGDGSWRRCRGGTAARARKFPTRPPRGRRPGTPSGGCAGSAMLWASRGIV